MNDSTDSEKRPHDNRHGDRHLPHGGGIIICAVLGVLIWYFILKGVF